MAADIPLDIRDNIAAELLDPRDSFVAKEIQIGSADKLKLIALISFLPNIRIDLKFSVYSLDFCLGGRVTRGEILTSSGDGSLIV
jgi:hypothetical protein